MMGKRGRPAALPEDPVTYDQAVEVIKAELWRRYNNEELVVKCSYAKGTLKNMVSLNQLRSWRIGRHAVLSKAEVLKLVS